MSQERDTLNLNLSDEKASQNTTGLISFVGGATTGEGDGNADAERTHDHANISEGVKVSDLLIHPEDPPFAPFGEPGQPEHYVHAPADFNVYADFPPTWYDFFPSDPREGQRYADLGRTGYNANDTSSYTSASGARVIAGTSYAPLGTNTSSFLPTYETFNKSSVSSYGFPPIPPGPPSLPEPNPYDSYGNNQTNITSQVNFPSHSNLPSDQIAPKAAVLATDARFGALREANVPIKEDPIFMCDVTGCLRTFAKVGERNKHQRYHQLPLQCPHCTQRCPDEKDLERHVNTHQALKPYRCLHGNCGRRFTRSDNALRHLKNDHGIRGSARKALVRFDGVRANLN